MKKCLIAFALLICVSQAFAQGNDSTKYIYYKYVYGNRLARYRADTVIMIPKDTIWSKDGLALKGGVLYTGNGVGWSKVSYTAGGGIPSDYSYYVTDTSVTRDTTLTLPCGTKTLVYTKLNLPLFVGYRVQVTEQGFTLTGVPNGKTLFCDYLNPYYDWNSTTGDIYFYADGPRTPGFVGQYFQISAY